jgi:hypothetical protein
MKLALTLSQTGDVWILEDTKEYSIGCDPTCSIVLPYKRFVNNKHLTLAFDSKNNSWNITVLNGEKQTLINETLTGSFSISDKANIVLGAKITLLATPVTTSEYEHEKHSRLDQAKSEVSARLISGSAYLNGLSHSLTLLSNIRTDPYKSNSPEASLDIEKIATHAAQAVALFLTFAIIGVSAFLLQLIICWADFGLFNGTLSWLQSWISSNFLLFIALILGSLDSIALNQGSAGLAFIYFLDLFAALAIAYELTYLRWSIAKRFLKINFVNEFQFSGFQKLVSALRRRTRKIDPYQNVIVFGGFKPFLGAGQKIKNSDITVSINRNISSSGETCTESVNIPEKRFYDSIDNEVSKLNLPNTETLAQLHVKGFELNTDDLILFGRLSQPVPTLSESQIWEMGQENFKSDKRAYRVYRHIDEKRDNVLSYFVRFYNLGTITFVEAVAYGLTSFDRRRFSLSPVLKYNRALKLGHMLLIFLLISQFRIYLLIAFYQLFISIKNLLEWKLLDIQSRRSARLHEEYNYGLKQTFRESIANPFDSNYYGNQDLVMYWRSIQQAVFKGIISVLKEENLDTSQFEKSAQAIVNHGVMVTGGSLRTDNLLIGQGAGVKVFNNLINNLSGNNPQQKG